MKHAVRRRDSFFTQQPFIVDPGCVNDYNRSERQQFHRFAHSICCSPFNRAYDGHFLIGHRIDQAAFACISFTEKADMDAFR